MVAVLLRDDVRHVLARRRCSRTGRRSSTRAGRSSSPTARARTRRGARGRAGGRARPRCAARRRARGASSTTFSTTSSPECEEPVRVPVRDEARARGGRPRSSVRPTPRGLERRARAGRARARASAAGRRVALLGDEPQAVVVGRRTPELQPRAGDEHVPPVDRELAEHARVEVDDGARPPASSTPSRVGRTARPRAARRGRATAGCSCCQATSWPAGAQSVASRRKKRNVTKRSPRRRAAGSSATSSDSAGRDAQRRQLRRRCAARRRRSAPTRRGSGRGR